MAGSAGSGLGVWEGVVGGRGEGVRLPGRPASECRPPGRHDGWPDVIDATNIDPPHSGDRIDKYFRVITGHRCSRRKNTVWPERLCLCVPHFLVLPLARVPIPTLPSPLYSHPHPHSTQPPLLPPPPPLHPAPSTPTPTPTLPSPLYSHPHPHSTQPPLLPPPPPLYPAPSTPTPTPTLPSPLYSHPHPHSTPI